MVECGGLENRWARKGLLSSNLSLSANYNRFIEKLAVRVRLGVSASMYIEARPRSELLVQSGRIPTPPPIKIPVVWDKSQPLCYNV